MRTATILIGWLLLTALLCWLQYITCCGSPIINNGISKAPTAFTVTGDGLKVNCEYKAYARSNENLVTPINNENDCHSALANYIKEHPGDEIIVEGRYSSAEEYVDGFYPNLGLARASQIKSDIIRTFGVSGNQIKTNSLLVDDSAFVADTLQDGYRLSLTELEKADFSDFNPEEREIVLHFNTGSSNPILTPEIRTEFSQFINYIDANPGSNLLVTGHTDTQGDAEANLVLGQNRADEIKEYLNRNGISRTRINTDSKGEELPVSDVDAENRRVTINIQSNNQ